MFKFFKRKKKEEKKEAHEEKKPVSQKMSEGIHTMPKQFYLGKEQKTGGRKKKTIVIVVIVVVGLAVMATASVLIYNSMKAQVDIQEENEADKQAAIPEPDPIPEPEPEPEPDPEMEEIEPPELEPRPIELQTQPELQVPQIIITGAQDLDEDSLTLNEEKIYSTDPGKADTDNDTYSDGEEILNSFSPTQVGGRLVDSGLVEVYVDTKYGFQMFHPARWLVSINDADEKREIIFNSKVGEIITLTVFEKETNVPASGEFTEIIRGDFDEVYAFVYEPIFQNYRNFETTFKMMVQSFEK